MIFVPRQVVRDIRCLSWCFCLETDPAFCFPEMKYHALCVAPFGQMSRSCVLLCSLGPQHRKTHTSDIQLHT